MRSTRDSGFTLIEAMVTLAVSSILLVIAIPSYQTFVKSNCSSSQQNDFVTSLHFARQEAVRRGLDITVTARDDSDSNNRWGKLGWDVTDPDGVVLRRHEAVGCSLNLNSDDSNFTYQSNGRVAASVSFKLCDPRNPGIAGRSITIENTGRVQSGETSCSS
ncbi:GspH/FimT family pseudopilin [Pseudomonadota bacterium]